MKKQIFILGRNRSGTKWLSNILANNTEVSAVQREGAGGILESNLLKYYPLNFNIKNIEDKTAFEILFKESNFHRCSGLKDTVLLDKNYTSFFDFFEKYMNEIADLRNTTYWLQKVGSLNLPLLYKYFSNAKFVIIQRENVFDNVLSSILLGNNTINKITTLQIIKSVRGYWQHKKEENRFYRKKNVLTVKYEDLKNDTEALSKDICNFIEITYDKKMLDVLYKPNTSYNKNKREDYLTSWNINRVRFFSLIFSILPLAFINYSPNKKAKRKSLFHPLTFQLYRNELSNR